MSALLSYLSPRIQEKRVNDALFCVLGHDSTPVNPGTSSAAVRQVAVFIGFFAVSASKTLD